MHPLWMVTLGTVGVALMVAACGGDADDSRAVRDSSLVVEPDGITETTVDVVSVDVDPLAPFDRAYRFDEVG